ncbi:MAG: SDR family oxidoreductase [Candidatus Lokiarchaeota archaeon]|nr:SDR family oxidoreductase [Candidatus Lokiarchaeota archaeon]
MVNLLKEKTIVITGAGRGIGKAIAEVCAKEGANVVLGDIDEESAKNSAKEIAEKYNVKAAGIGGNVANKEDAEKMASAAIELDKNRKIWGLVNNAGITRDSFFKKMTEEQWDQVMNVNLKGVFWCTKAVIPHIEDGGSIVNISSIVGKGGNLGQTNYCTTKAGLVGFSKALAKEMARNSVRVNAVQPGFIKTPMTDKIPQKVVDKLLPLVPLGRWGQPEDVANSVLFLLSDLSSFITGAVIEVAGGMFM